MEKQTVPRIEALRVKNYRALRDVELKKITPLSAFLGPNGSGKSTLFDIFAFLAECFTVGLRSACDKRGRFKELQTRGSHGSIEFELKYRERPGTPIITYHLAINEGTKGAYVGTESLQWRRASRGRPFRFLHFQQGAGRVIAGETPEEGDERIDERLDDASMLAVSTLGQLARHPRVSALRRFITGWHLSYLSADATRGLPKQDPKSVCPKRAIICPTLSSI